MTHTNMKYVMRIYYIQYNACICGPQPLKMAPKNSRQYTIGASRRNARIINESCSIGGLWKQFI